MAAEKKKKPDRLQNQQPKMTKKQQEKELEAEAKKRLDVEVHHQREEAETQALGQAMMKDAEKNRPSLNTSCLKLLNNFQGILITNSNFKNYFIYFNLTFFIFFYFIF